MRGFGKIVIFLAVAGSFLGGTAYGACSVLATNVDFGNYDVFSPAPTDSSGTIVVFCFPPPWLPFYNVRVEIGPSSVSGGFNPRRMRRSAGSDLLDYNLFTDPAMTRIWGDGTGGTYVVNRRVRTWRVRWIRVYGRIPAGQDVPAGSYTDNVRVTIFY